MKCFESTHKHQEESSKYPRRITHQMTTTLISACYHAVGRSPDMQLEKLFPCCQVIVVIRRPNMDKSLVRLQMEGDVPHLRTSGFDCRETTVTDQQ